MSSAYLLVGYNMSTPNPCQLGSPVWPYPVLAGYPKTLHLNDYVATMDGTIPLVVSFLALATGNLPPSPIWERASCTPMPMYSAGFSTLASFGNADEDGEREYKG